MWVQKKTIIKNLFKKKKNNWGRNNTGLITIRHRGGSRIKSKTKLIDYNRYIWNLPAIVIRLEKSTKHSTYLALLSYPIGILTFIPAPLGIKIGDILIAGSKNIAPEKGNNTLLKEIPLNTLIHNIENKPGYGGVYIRTAGNWAKILEKNYINKTAKILFKNGKIKLLNFNCSATIGRLSNLHFIKKKIKKKAGENRNSNRRPKVRGVAKNPVDHPHGGGRGKKSPKNPNYNFKRLLIKGKKTAKKRI